MPGVPRRSSSRVCSTFQHGAAGAFLEHHVSGNNYECMELMGPGSPRYLELYPTQARRVDVEELVNEGVVPSRGPLDVSSAHTRSVEVRNDDILVLGFGTA